MFKTGTILEKIKSQSQKALRSGALDPLGVTSSIIKEHNIPFIVHLADCVEQKEQAEREKTKDDHNPLLHYEPDLFVGDLTGSHLCLLNKFYIKPHHILIVTKEPKEQETLLSPADFEALRLCMDEFSSLGFYNSSHLAGASQKHKHLQAIPLPFGTGGGLFPLEETVNNAVNSQRSRLDIFPFVHGIKDIRYTRGLSAAKAGRALFTEYSACLEETGLLKKEPSAPGESLCLPYNMIITGNWMMLVGRKSPGFEGIGINALGFSGTFLVKNREQLALLSDMGPLKLLREVSLQELT